MPQLYASHCVDIVWALVDPETRLAHVMASGPGLFIVHLVLSSFYQRQVLLST